MIFIFGISNGRKELDYHQSILCTICGKYGRYLVFMEYMYFSLFFIPVFKWNKTYYVRSTCCGALYTIDRELGNRIARGENVILQESDLHLVNKGCDFGLKRCSRCGYETREDYRYCPKCANPLDG
ncbi:MAG TPA: zinc ribbon domain-containing protein [Clostridiales bacterium]|nr:zinc ribbon domain-containing protein [Clostridiales bacterium]